MSALEIERPRRMCRRPRSLMHCHPVSANICYTRQAAITIAVLRDALDVNRDERNAGSICAVVPGRTDGRTDKRTIRQRDSGYRIHIAILVVTDVAFGPAGDFKFRGNARRDFGARDVGAVYLDRVQSGSQAERREEVR